MSNEDRGMQAGSNVDALMMSGDPGVTWRGQSKP